MTIFHVSPNGDDAAAGTAQVPLRTIQHAADLARPGDTVLVHAGTYREWVRPPRGGRSDLRRITFAAAPKEHAVITGAEVVSGWIEESPGLWSICLSNRLFSGQGVRNPFATELSGDWLVRPDPRDRMTSHQHLGQLFLDGRAFSEASSLEALGQTAPTTLLDDWTRREVPAPDANWAARQWFALVDEGKGTTNIYAYFGSDTDPNEHLTEISVRPAVFAPVRAHINWITVRGFELAQAATQWAPPTAAQEGLIAPNWAKGWIIEDNVIRDSRCSGISLGKEASTGENFAAERRDKPGYLYQLESVFAARQIGWDREHIGSHIVRRNRIFACGQTGIVGHLGCVFSVIEDNDIFDIATRRDFFGHEIAGIKLHAAIDVAIRHNHIHKCTLAIWLDWQTQGTRISRNVLHANSRDLFIEVSHGPYIVDHNVLASPAALEVVSDGGAFVHNLVAGTVRLEPVLDRATPYHRPHSTQVAGYSVIPGGDDRWAGNLFVGGSVEEAYGPDFHSPGGVSSGLSCYEAYPDSTDGFMSAVLTADGSHDHDTYVGRRLPVHVAGNTYAGGACPFDRESGGAVLKGAVSVDVVAGDVEAPGSAGPVRGWPDSPVVLEITLPEGFEEAASPTIVGEGLERSYFTDAEFEDPDGRPVDLSEDLIGHSAVRGESLVSGPVHSLQDGENSLAIW